MGKWLRQISRVTLCVFQFSSVAQSCPTLCNPMNRSTPGLPVHHQPPEFTQTHIHRVRDAVQPISSSVVPFSSCPQSLPASESFPMSQLFAWGGQSTGLSLAYLRDHYCLWAFSSGRLYKISVDVLVIIIFTEKKFRSKQKHLKEVMIFVNTGFLELVIDCGSGSVSLNSFWIELFGKMPRCYLVVS